MGKTVAEPCYSILVISDYRSVTSSRPEAEIFIRLAQLGHKVVVLSYPDAAYYNERFRLFGIEVIEKHPTSKLSLSYIKYLRNLVRINQFDFVHVFNTKGLTNAVWALIGLPSKLIAYRGYAGQTHFYDPMMYTKYFHSRVDQIICVSDEVKKVLSRNMAGAKHKLTTIPKGHDPDWYKDIVPADRSKLGFSQNDILVCFMANVRPFKGLNYVFDATHLLSTDLHVHFLFIGSGYDDEAVKSQIEKSPLQYNLHVLGYRSDALSIIATCDCLLLASTHGEGLSKAVIEAMSLGIAPIITDIRANEGLLVNGESGWIVPAKDANAIAKAIVEMAKNKDERLRRGMNAKAHMHDHFHINQTVDGFLALYEKLRCLR